MGFDVVSVKGFLRVCILSFLGSALVIPAWTRDKDTDVVNGIVNKTKYIPWQEVDAWDNCHCAINQLALMIALDVLLNGMMKSRKVIYKVCQPLMANDMAVSLVKILQHPQIAMRPPILVASKIGVNKLDMHHPCGHFAESVEENLLWVDPVVAGVAVAKVPGTGRKDQLSCIGLS
jgi:hypothetical protein